jgi:tetratricopeptide (TPR) repeat protein
MAGQCYQALGELEMACDCYLASLKIDPQAICAVEQLTNIAPCLGNSALVNWSKLRLIELQEQKQRISAKPKRSYISEVYSELKTTEQAMSI